MPFASARRCAAFSLVASVVLAGESRPAAADVIPEVVVTPNLSATSASRTGSTVTVITAEEIARMPTQSVAQLLRSVPGVTVTESGGVGGQTVVSLRGTEAQHTLVLIDGVRVNDPASARNDFDFALFSVTDIERIEVLRGPQSALYGSDAIGGVINIITRGTDGPPRFKVSAEGGSYGTRQTNFAASTGAGALSLSASGNYFATDGFSRVGDRENGEPDATEKFAGSIRGTFDPGTGSLFEFGLNGYRQDSDIDASSTKDATGYSSERDLLAGYGRFTFPSADGRIVNSLEFSVSNTSRTFVEPKTVYDYRGTEMGIEYRSIIDLAAAGTLTGGLTVDQETAYQKKSTASSPVFDEKRYLFAGYLLYDVPVGENLDLTFAGRHDGQFGGGDGFTTGRATALYNIPGTTAAIRGSFGTGAKRPTAFQLSYNPDLLPEKSLGADLGIEKSLLDGRFNLSVTGFWNQIEDMINYDPDLGDDGNYANIDEARTQGVEVAARLDVVPGVLSAKATYTYLDARDLSTGLPLARQPQNSGTIGLVYTGIAKLEATILATLVGPRFNDDAAEERLDPYTRIDLTADYRFTDSLAVYGRVENLLDADYEERDGYNTAGLSAYVGLRWKN